MSDLFIVIAMIYSVLCALITAAIAVNKGRNNIAWAFAGLFFGLIALVIIALIPQHTQRWTCSKCGEKNKLKDDICDNCGTKR
jgi:ribosomal protein S27AE